MSWAVTVILSLLMMLVFFLMLWSAVGFIQNKKFFSSAPQGHRGSGGEERRTVQRATYPRLGHDDPLVRFLDWARYLWRLRWGETWIPLLGFLSPVPDDGLIPESI